MAALARVSLVLVVILVVVSAYLRLQHSGMGCPDWPACYGMIGVQEADSESLAQSAYQRIVNESSAPLAWAAPLHRLVASVLGLCVLFLALLSLKARRHRLISLALLALTVFLAVIGLRSGGMHSPAVVMGNLGGGFAMVGLLGWMVFSGSAVTPGTAPSPIRSLTWLGIFLLVLQILLGGLTSANFAALACTSLPDCQGSYLPGPELGEALKLNRTIDISEVGVAIGGAERQAIHMAHRVGAVLALVFVLAAAIPALRSDSTRRTAIGVMALVLAEFALGITAILTGLPIGLAVAHNWLAALLLLAMLKLARRQSA